MIQPAKTSKPLKPRVLILSTGGTITAEELEDQGLQSTPFDLKRLQRAIPDIGQLAQIDVREVMRKDSVNMTPADWVVIGQAVHEGTKSYDGIVVLHGLDTLPYTASALSFMVQNLPIPVVLTGATFPLEYVSSDGKRNLIDAISVAAQADLAEVCVVSDGRIFRGNRIKKVEEVDFCTFESIIVPPLGMIKGNPLLTDGYRKRNPRRKARLDTRFEPSVAAILAYPGLSPAIVESIIRHCNPRGLVLLGYGSGCIPVDGSHSILPLVRDFNSRSGHVVVTTQVTFGQCFMTFHEVGRQALEAGALSAHDMTYETTIVKLMWVLGHTSDKEMIRTMLMTNYAGEVTPQIMDGGEDKFNPNDGYSAFVKKNISIKE